MLVQYWIVDRSYGNSAYHEAMKAAVTLYTEFWWLVRFNQKRPGHCYMTQKYIYTYDCTPSSSYKREAARLPRLAQCPSRSQELCSAHISWKTGVEDSISNTIDELMKRFTSWSSGRALSLGFRRARGLWGVRKEVYYGYKHNRND
jgi:hypothetical protein